MAVVLSLLTAGLGHLYAGQLKRAVFFWCLSWVLSMSMLFLAVAGLLLPRWHAPWNLLPLLVLLGCSAGYFIYLVVDTIRTARAATAFHRRWFNRWYIYAGIMIVSAIVGDIDRELLKQTYVEAFWFPSGSMQPTLLVGDHFFVDKQAYPTGELPQGGDVVVFVSPIDEKIQLVKRAVAVAGDNVEIRQKKLYINGAPINEPYIRFVDVGDFTSPRDNYGPVVVAEEHFFVLGDNRDQSYDSRFWGFVSVENLRGRPAMIYWSRDRGMPRWNRIGLEIR